MAILLHISFKIVVKRGITAHIVAQITSASKANVYSCTTIDHLFRVVVERAGDSDVTIM